MPIMLSETLITVIDGKPHKFAVRLQEHLSEDDFKRDIRYVYLFEGTGQSNPKDNLRFAVKVTDEVVDFHFLNNEKGLHNEVIAFGLHSINRKAEERVFYFTTDEFDRIKALPRKNGPELRNEVLSFVYAINSHWPDESVSYVDLQDNLIGVDREGGHWLNALVSEGLLDRKRGFKNHSRDRGMPSTPGYQLAARARKEVESEINPKVAASGQGRQDRSVHIEQAGNVQIITGDNARVNNVFAGQQVISSAQDFVEALKELNRILSRANMSPGLRVEMENAVTEAEAEVTKDKPEKGKIAKALEKAVTLAKLANNAKELMVLATPVVTKTAGWLGEAGRHLIGLLT